MGRSRLDHNRDEIMMMLGEGKNQAEIIRHFKTRGVTIPPQTLSDYLKKQSETDIMTATALDNPGGGQVETLSVQLETTMRFQRDMAETVVNTMGDVIEAVQELKRDGQALPETIAKALPVASGETEEVKAALLATESKIDALLSRTAAPALFGIWTRSLLVTAFGWGIGIALWYYAWPLV